MELPAKPAGASLRRLRRPGVLSLLTSFLVASSACAQNPPHIGYLYPAGGRQGATFHVVVGGQFLGNVSNALISGAGVQAKLVEYNRPLNQKEFNDLRDQLKALQDKRQANRKSPDPTNTWTAADEKTVDEIKAKILKNPPNRQGNPAIAETVTLQLSVSTNAGPGEREIRLATPNGLSNPLLLCVGQLPEFSKAAAKTTGPDIEKFLERLGRKPMPAKSEARITLPATVNGQILPGAVDRYRFFARDGQRLVVAVSARGLIPYLPDAVPGWFQATLALYDAKGVELQYADDYRFNPDPVLYYRIPRNGDYVIEIKDSIYRGREDFVYRIAIGDLPFVTSLFPLGAPAGAGTTVEMKGWNLPAPDSAPEAALSAVPTSSGTRADTPSDRANADPRTVIRQEIRFTEPGIHQLCSTNGERVSNRMPFAVDTLPECLEQEPNNAPAHAQRVSLPVIVNGRIDEAGDVDVFGFEGRAGDDIVAEVNARRLNSPLDSVLRLTDATGRQIAFNDDNEDKGAGLETHHADSYLHAPLPTNGMFYLSLGDTQRKGGAEFGYRLRLGPPRPDFALRVVPSSLSVRPGGSVPLTVYALRKDGFSGAIALELKGAPEGFALSGAQVPANQDKVRFTLTAPATLPDNAPDVANRSAGLRPGASAAAADPNAPDRRSALPTTGSPAPFPIFALSLEGWAVIGGQAVLRPAVPAEDMMQAFAYRHLVPAKEFAVAVNGRRMPPVRILGGTPVKLPAGGRARIRLGPAGPKFTENFQLELSDPPEGITLQSVSPVREGVEIELATDDAKIKPGLHGNLIINVLAARPAGGDKAKNRPESRRILAGALPAIPFEIVARPEPDAP
jgi:hypothetical protein